MKRFLLIFLLSLALPAVALAQTSKYSTWSDPSKPASQGAGTADVTGFADKLNKLIDEAEKARAADPTFLKDLRALANSYSIPTLRTIFSDTFEDGNYTQGPAWNVSSGAYFIESGWGLRNKILEAGQPAQTEQKVESGEDLAVALLGSILQQATGAQQQQQAAASAQTRPQENLITSSVRISNAFVMEMDVSSWVANGHFEAGLYQGSNANVGYRILYQSGQPLQLLKVGSKGRSTIAQSNTLLTIEDKKFHTIRWSREASGEMIVSVGGKEMIRVTDKSFSDAFDGVRLSDQGGDFIVKRISVDGV